MCNILHQNPEKKDFFFLIPFGREVNPLFCDHVTSCNLSLDCCFSSINNYSSVSPKEVFSSTLACVKMLSEDSFLEGFA